MEKDTISKIDRICKLRLQIEQLESIKEGVEKSQPESIFVKIGNLSYQVKRHDCEESYSAILLDVETDIDLKLNRYYNELNTLLK